MDLYDPCFRVFVMQATAVAEGMMMTDNLRSTSRLFLEAIFQSHPPLVIQNAMRDMDAMRKLMQETCNSAHQFAAHYINAELDHQTNGDDANCLIKSAEERNALLDLLESVGQVFDVIDLGKDRIGLIAKDSELAHFLDLLRARMYRARVATNHPKR